MPPDNEWVYGAAVRVIGALVGVLASLIMVAPEGTRAALYRALVGVTMGVIFSPLADSLPFMGWMAGEDLDAVLARSALTGFVIWWVLEVIARLLSSNDWLVALLREMARMRSNQEPRK
ncbi:DUF6107 family protein [Sagittula stellata]|uniref:DUF6107 family protein n=1 Tax=Sagittula stellata TaxID=52603 RepID=UPI00058DFEC5|nr:DUF6107 family protein [Sagittula stellata]